MAFENVNHANLTEWTIGLLKWFKYDLHGTRILRASHLASIFLYSQQKKMFQLVSGKFLIFRFTCNTITEGLHFQNNGFYIPQLLFGKALID